MKHLIYFFAIALVSIQGSTITHAQMQYNETNPYLKSNAYWAWFNYIGIDWATGVPVYDSNNLTSNYVDSLASGSGSSSVADPYTGELLFYTQGGWIWDKNHEAMPNGTHLTGAVRPGQYARQTLIVPFPGDSTKYYLFVRHAGAGGPSEGEDGTITYSIVDMTLNNGDGDVVSGMKDILLTSMSSVPDDLRYQTMTAVPGNNCDIWLVAPATAYVNVSGGIRTYDSTYYHAYRIDATGISPVPVVSSANWYGFNMAMRVAPDRTKLLVYGLEQNFKGNPQYDSILASKGLTNPTWSEVSRFDPETGEVSELTPIGYRKQQNFDPTAVASDFFNISSASFSPDNKILYTVNVNFNGNEIYLTQFDVEQLDSASIAQSQTVVDSLVNYNNTFTTKAAWCGVDQKSPNLKLYNDTIFVSWAHSNKIGSINKPNVSGPACELQIDYFSLPIDKLNFGRPFYEVVYPMHFDNALILDTQVCTTQLLKPRVVNSLANYKWSNGETSSTIEGVSGQEYWVTYSFLANNCLQVYTDTFKLHWEGLDPKPEITVNVDTLSTALPYSTYQWLYEGNIMSGETNAKLVVTTNGHYRVIVTNSEGCSDSSNVYEVTNKGTSIANMSNELAVRIYPNPTRDIVYVQYQGDISYKVFDITGKDLSRLQSGKEIDLSAFEPGVYQLIIWNKENRKLGSWKISKL